MLESEEEDMPGAPGEFPRDLSVIPISEDEEGGGGGGACEHSSESGDEPPVDEYEALLAQFLSRATREAALCWCVC